MFNFEALEREAQKGKEWRLELRTDGGVAQLGEHLLCTQGVRSSNLLISTRGRGRKVTGLTNGLIAQVVRAHA